MRIRIQENAEIKPVPEMRTELEEQKYFFIQSLLLLFFCEIFIEYFSCSGFYLNSESESGSTGTVNGA